MSLNSYSKSVLSLDEAINLYDKEMKDIRLAVNKIVDDSLGDYSSIEYNIIQFMPWGIKTIGTTFDDPRYALLFTSAPNLIEEIKRLRAEILGLKGEKGI